MRAISSIMPNGFGNVIVRTGVQADYLVVLRVFRGQQNDRNPRRIRAARRRR